MTPLEEYRHKRDFGKTPEPTGEEPMPHEGLLYVIQKHAASRLHWDFRIELGGVLLSWAVPKGPSLDTADKRLAMHVEDHPLEYGTFEGVIPKGEYGGGTVMLWDLGTWVPDHGDPAEHLAQGHLKFYLYGERLRGKWMLVRTKGYGGNRDSWLLFKERDEEVRPRSEFDATKEWMTSVSTGRTMEQIAADIDAVWHSASHPALPDLAQVPGAELAAMPSRLDVELATLVKQVPEGDQWIHEVKFDGYRILARLHAGEVRLISRNGIDWTERFSAVAEALKRLEIDSAVLDGEMVVQRADGTTDFQALQNYVKRGRAATLEYFAFDLLYLDGYDLRRCTLEHRKELLRAVVPERDPILHYTDHIDGHGDVFYARACEYSLEGVVSKRRGSTYRSGRGHDWLKSKCLLEQEFVVVAFTDPGGSRSKFGALGVAANTEKGLTYVGRVGTGFTEASLEDLYAQLQPLERDAPPVVNPPKGVEAKGIHWVEPRLVVEVAFAEFTEDGSLRHPSFSGLREDKAADEIVIESPAETPSASEADAVATASKPAGGGAAQATEADQATVAGVQLTNPDRVLWPDVPFTKLGLARYYEQVAERMLPHIAGRPLSLVRCPQGYTGECFYQKHVENFPKSVDTVRIAEPGAEKLPYAVVHDLGGIVGLAQMGVLEMHPWGSREDEIEKPDRIVFDLDPDTDLPWSQLAATAMLLRSELQRLGLDSWVKSTGGKGLHVVLPVTRRLEWGPAKDFARAFVDSIVAIEPRMFTANMRKAERTGKIFIDYLRNSRGATAIAPFSTRARPGAPISVPLSWEELAEMPERPEFTVLNVGPRLAMPDPWADIGSARQSITKGVRARLGLA